MIWTRVKDARFVIILLCGLLLSLSDSIVAQHSGNLKVASFVLIGAIAVAFTLYCKRTIGQWVSMKYRLCADVILFAFVALSVIKGGSFLVK